VPVKEKKGEEVAPDVKFAIDKLVAIAEKMDNLTKERDLKELFRVLAPYMGKSDSCCNVEAIINKAGYVIFDEEEKNKLIAANVRMQVAAKGKETIEASEIGFDRFGHE